jgi:hypothetical protein
MSSASSMHMRVPAPLGPRSTVVSSVFVFQLEAAMSRWAQGLPPTNYPMNMPPSMVPASPYSEFLRSAIWLRRRTR